MQLGLLLAVVAAITVSENAPAEPVSSAAVRFLLALAATGGVVLFAVIGSKYLSRSISRDGEARDRLLCARSFLRLKRWHLLLWLTIVGVVLYVLNWPQIVRYNWGLNHAVLLRDALVLAPIWLPLLFSWGAFYEVERAAFDATRADGTPGDPDFTSRGRFIWLQTRHYLGLCVLPVLVLLCFHDLVAFIAPRWQASDYGWMLYLVPLAALMLVFPQLLSYLWQTDHLPAGPLRSRLETLARRMGIRCREFLVWQTDGQMMNAAVAGLLPAGRYVFLTDALLAYLRDDEIEAIVAHELGHVQRRHLLLRMMLIGLPLWWAACLQGIWPELFAQGNGPFDQVRAVAPATGYLAVPLATVVYAWLALGWYSRALEHDADLSVFYIGRGAEFAAAVDRLAHLCGDRRSRSSWLHPSTDRRIELLRQTLQDAGVARRYRRRIASLNAGLLAAWMLAPAATLLVSRLL